MCARSPVVDAPFSPRKQLSGSTLDICGMQEAWIPLECVACGEQWEKPPSSLPAPGNEFTCDHCDTTRPVSEFVRTQESLKMLKQFHQ